MLYLTFTEKQDLLIILGAEIDRLTRKCESLPKKSNKVSINDMKKSLPKLIERHNELWSRINKITPIS